MKELSGDEKLNQRKCEIIKEKKKNATEEIEAKIEWQRKRDERNGNREWEERRKKYEGGKVTLIRREKMKKSRKKQ